MLPNFSSLTGTALHFLACRKYEDALFFFFFPPIGHFGIFADAVFNLRKRPRDSASLPATRCARLERGEQMITVSLSWANLLNRVSCQV